MGDGLNGMIGWVRGSNRGWFEWEDRIGSGFSIAHLNASFAVACCSGVCHTEVLT